ncbi:MAG: hypothetical protein ACKVOQ_06025 [Cyclobacteriaceae bacterium]
MNTIQDLLFDDYNRRQSLEVSIDSINQSSFNTKQAGHFIFENDFWSPLPYEGFAVVSMLDEDKVNEPLSNRLVGLQKDLRLVVEPSNGFYFLPPESFHQTIANTLSADRFNKHIVETGLEVAYPDLVKKAFETIPVFQLNQPIRMKMIGLAVFGTAIGILGIFENESEYKAITQFRSAFYNDAGLSQLDVKMTRPFIGHVTLAYIESDLDVNQESQLAHAMNEINESLKSEMNYFAISSAELRRYHHLAEFTRKDNFPIFRFN